jgi:hypothetical protein
MPHVSIRHAQAKDCAENRAEDRVKGSHAVAFMDN